MKITQISLVLSAMVISFFLGQITQYNRFPQVSDVTIDRNKGYSLITVYSNQSKAPMTFEMSN
jgi:hypothetical protein